MVCRFTVQAHCNKFAKNRTASQRSTLLGFADAWLRPERYVSQTHRCDQNTTSLHCLTLPSRQRASLIAPRRRLTRRSPTQVPRSVRDPAVRMPHGGFAQRCSAPHEYPKVGGPFPDAGKHAGRVPLFRCTFPPFALRSPPPARAAPSGLLQRRCRHAHAPRDRRARSEPGPEHVGTAPRPVLAPDATPHIFPRPRSCIAGGSANRHALARNSESDSCY